jgi:hypothetical protein
MHMITELRQVADRAHKEVEAYQGDHLRPLRGYLIALAAYGTVVLASAFLAATTGRELPPRWQIQDLIIAALGSHKLSRIVSKSAVTSPLRAPFAQYAGTAGPSEVDEETRRSSPLRHSLGELLTCPFCLDVWVLTVTAIGLLFAPRLTRFIAGGLAALAGADFLQLAYARAQQAAE